MAKGNLRDRINRATDRIKYNTWDTVNNKIPDKAKEMTDKASFKTWQATDASKTAVADKSQQMTGALAEKHRFVKSNIDAKKHIRDFADGEMDKEQIAHLIASDAELRESMSEVSHNMLHPDPIKGAKTERTNLQFDLGYGFSVFREEMNKPLDEEVEAIMELDNMSTMVEMGQDQNVPPHIRETYLHEAGIEDTSAYVTQNDYRDYVQNLENKFRQEHMERLGLADKDMLDAYDEEQLENLVEDSMSMTDAEGDTFLYISDQPEENTYESVYNMTSEEMFQMFDDADNYENLDYDDIEFPEYIDYDFEDTEFMRHAVEEYHNVQSMTIDESEAYLASIEEDMMAQDAAREANAPDMDYNPEDARKEPQKQDSDAASLEDNAPPELSDDDLASLEDNAPPELSDDDLASLEDNAPPELDDEDLEDLEENQQQR